MIQKILYFKLLIIELEVEYVIDVVCNGWGDQCYVYINCFEKQFVEFVGMQYVIVILSCIGVMYMGLVVFGIGVGDEVILVDMNWIVMVLFIIYVGVMFVFVDILLDIWCLDLVFVEVVIMLCMKVIIVMYFYGNLCEMDCLLDIGKCYGIFVIEDVVEVVGFCWYGYVIGL